MNSNAHSMRGLRLFWVDQQVSNDALLPTPLDFTQLEPVEASFGTSLFGWLPVYMEVLFEKMQSFFNWTTGSTIHKLVHGIPVSVTNFEISHLWCYYDKVCETENTSYRYLSTSMAVRMPELSYDGLNVISWLYHYSTLVPGTHLVPGTSYLALYVALQSTSTVYEPVFNSHYLVPVA